MVGNKRNSWFLLTGLWWDSGQPDKNIRGVPEGGKNLLPEFFWGGDQDCG